MTREDIRELHCIMPIANLRSVMQSGILSHNRTKRIGYASIALEDVQDRRRSKRVPVVIPDAETQQKLDALVDRITSLKKQWHVSGRPDDLAHEIDMLDSEINSILFNLYDLADDERGFVLSSTGSVRSRRGTHG